MEEVSHALVVIGRRGKGIRADCGPARSDHVPGSVGDLVVLAQAYALVGRKENTMEKMSKQTVDMILSDCQGDIAQLQRTVANMQSGTMWGDDSKMDYQSLEMLRYAVRTLESRIKVLGGYNY